ncbi:hypothetical protein PEC18_26110 [Paucibacter sp. O1-1]|nr:hypothetical protein [Paucibacter sp. O1-1]MDA3829215.1 hypothetical protein [Paucibacter sp. O1-1]
MQETCEVRRIVDLLLRAGKASELAVLMVGDSPFNETSASETMSVPSGKPETDLAYTARMAWEHVQFMALFGAVAGPKKIGEHVCSAYPEYFEQWLEDGCFGLSVGDAQRCLREIQP